MKNTTKAVLLAIVVLTIIAIVSVATADIPKYKVNPPAMTAPYNSTGSISGRVTTFNQTIGIGNIDVWIVNPYNTSEYFYHGLTTSSGYFQFTSVNNTYDPTIPGYNATIYKAYANDTTWGEGYSANFSVEAGATTTCSVIIAPIPASIKIYAERYFVIADGSDNIRVWAYVTDKLGYPVADNTQIMFTIDPGRYFDPATWFLNMTGNWTGPADNLQNITVGTVGGYANVTFGWVPSGSAGNNSTLMASYLSKPTINDSTVIFFRPTVVSWFGSVVDSSGKGQGGIPVTLHVMGYTAGLIPYEVYNLSTVTLPDMPYPGAYVFDNIVKWQNVSFAYATANWSIQDGVAISGASDNYNLNMSRTSAGFIVMHIPAPDKLVVTANPDTILVGGDVSTIRAQLYLNNAPYHRNNVPITFANDNDAIAFFPSAVRTNMTDANGVATLQMQSNMTQGVENVLGYTVLSVVNNLSDWTQVRVVGWGTISGMVTDKNKNGVPNATVTLWRMDPASIANGTFMNTEKYPSPENPQPSVSNPNVAAIGTYTYYKIPWGFYNVTAEKVGADGINHVWFAIVNLTVGTATNNVAIPDLIVGGGPSVIPSGTPTATATATATASPTPTATPTSTPTPGFELVFAMAGLLGVAYLLARKEH